MEHIISTAMWVIAVLLIAPIIFFAVLQQYFKKVHLPRMREQSIPTRTLSKWRNQIRAFNKDPKATWDKKYLKEVEEYEEEQFNENRVDDGSPFPAPEPTLKTKLLRYRTLNFFNIIIIPGITIVTGIGWFMLLLPIVPAINTIQAIAVIRERDKMLDRIYNIASSSINFSKGRSRGRNQPIPGAWDYINVETWGLNNTPIAFTITHPAGAAPELSSQENFRKAFERLINRKLNWKIGWESDKDEAKVEAIKPLPTKLMYPGTMGGSWSNFVVGKGIEGLACYDVTTFPHVLIAGPSGSGKSVLQRNLVFHTIQHNYRWEFYGIDIKQVELDPYKKYRKTVKAIGLTVEDGLEILKYLNNTMMDRYAAMRQSGNNNVLDMENPPKSILIMVDEATMFLGASGSKTDEGKAEDAMKGEAADLVGKILRLGRASGIHMIIAMQRPDATVLRGEFKANMDVRLAAGRMDTTPSSMVLDSPEAYYLPGNIRGRGLLRVGGNMTEFQGYFAPQDWLDDLILDNPDMEPSTVLPGGHLYDAYIAKHGQPFSGGEMPGETQHDDNFNELQSKLNSTLGVEESDEQIATNNTINGLLDDIDDDDLLSVPAPQPVQQAPTLTEETVTNTVPAKAPPLPDWLKSDQEESVASEPIAPAVAPDITPEVEAAPVNPFTLPTKPSSSPAPPAGLPLQRPTNPFK